MSGKISVIVPVYNAEKYLERCLKSIISQTFEDIEIIVVDDGSTDSSPKICEYFAEIDNRINVIYKKENSGLGFARNSGLDAAKGEFIAFVDADDYVETDSFELLYNTALSEKCDIVYGGIYYNYGGKTIKKDCIDDIKVWKNKSEIRLFLLGLIGTMPKSNKNTEYEVSVWKSLYKKKLFDKYSVRFVSEKEFISEDIIFDIDYIQHANKIAMIPKCVYNYCINENSLCRIYRKDRFDKNIILYNEVKRRLSYIFSEDEYRIRTDRFLITKARVCINIICKSCDKYKNESIMKILNDSNLEEVLSRYDIKKMPKELALFTKFMKSKNIFMIRLLMFIKTLKNIF